VQFTLQDENRSEILSTFNTFAYLKTLHLSLLRKCELILMSWRRWQQIPRRP